MSRIGNRELTIPAGVTVTIDNSLVTVKGPKGELKLNVASPIIVEVSDNKVLTKRPNDEKHTKQLHGTTNSLIENMIIGVSEGYSIGLEAVGVGYRFNVNGKKIGISAGFSHPVEVIVPEGLEVKQESNTEITLTGIDKQFLTQFAANVRKIREPEPYKGKGIRYKGEKVRRKEGKKAAK
jgi:large subunit ribosomal protein L6